MSARSSTICTHVGAVDPSASGCEAATPASLSLHPPRERLLMEQLDELLFGGPTEHGHGRTDSARRSSADRDHSRSDVRTSSAGRGPAQSLTSDEHHSRRHADRGVGEPEAFNEGSAGPRVTRLKLPRPVADDDTHASTTNRRRLSEVERGRVAPGIRASRHRGPPTP